MAVIVPNAGATFNGATLEAALWQFLNWLQMFELNVSANPNRLNFISGSKDTETQIFSGNWKILAGQQRQADGSLKLIGVAHLSIPNVNFTPGTPGGTLKSQDWPALGLEILAMVTEMQNASNMSPRVTMSYAANVSDGESVGSYSGVFRLPYTTVLGDNGATIDTPTEWL